MTKKEILRKVWYVLSWLCLFYITVKFLLGKANTFSTIYMSICYSILALYLILSAIQKIVEKLDNYKAYKAYEKGFEYLKSVHKARYRLYFTGTSQEIEAYSAEIERYGNAMLNVGEDYISNNLLSKKHIKRVKEILDQIPKLMSTDN